MVLPENKSSPIHNQSINSFIVQGNDLHSVRTAIQQVGGTITHELGIIKSVGADLSFTQVEQLRDIQGIRKIYENSKVKTSVITNTVTVQIDSNGDDVEEVGVGATAQHSGAMYFDSSDMEIVEDSDYTGPQSIGLLFNALNVPAGAIITDASISFSAISVDYPSTNNDSAYFLIQGQNADNAAVFGNADYDLTSRARTAVAVDWAPVVWSSGVSYDTPDLSQIVQEIVNR